MDALLKTPPVGLHYTIVKGRGYDKANGWFCSKGATGPGEIKTPIVIDSLKCEFTCDNLATFKQLVETWKQDYPNRGLYYRPDYVNHYWDNTYCLDAINADSIRTTGGGASSVTCARDSKTPLSTDRLKVEITSNDLGVFKRMVEVYNRYTNKDLREFHYILDGNIEKASVWYISSFTADEITYMHMSPTFTTIKVDPNTKFFVEFECHAETDIYQQLVK